MEFSDDLIEALKMAKRVVVLTGAGVSAESGVPTFRGPDGIWKKFKAEDLATLDSFMARPELVWEWYNWRRDLMSNVKPNPGHMAITEMEVMFLSFWLVTQNVDGLHQRAGSKKVLPLHGNIFDSYCMECGKYYADPPFKDGLPRCSCGGLIRPDVVWFGEQLDPELITKAFDAAEKAQVFLSVGTSAVVMPAASLPVVAKRSGAYVVEINPERTELSDMLDEFIEGKSGEVMPELVKRLKAK